MQDKSAQIKSSITESNLDRSIRVKGNITESNLVSGDSVNSFNSSSQALELEDLLESLSKAVNNAKSLLSQIKSSALEEDLDRFATEVRKNKLSSKWYNLSAQSLIDSAREVGEAGQPILELVCLITKTLGLDD